MYYLLQFKRANGWSVRGVQVQVSGFWSYSSNNYLIQVLYRVASMLSLSTKRPAFGGEIITYIEAIDR